MRRILDAVAALAVLACFGCPAMGDTVHPYGYHENEVRHHEGAYYYRGYDGYAHRSVRRYFNSPRYFYPAYVFPDKSGHPAYAIGAYGYGYPYGDYPYGIPKLADR